MSEPAKGATRRHGDIRRAETDPQTAASARSPHRLSDHLDHGGIIQRGTGQRIKEVGKHLAGKTGTTNDAEDLWFIGYSPDLTVGVFMGYDQPRSLGDLAEAAHYTAPIFRDFMNMAFAGKPDIPFRAPPGIKLIWVSAKTGIRTSASSQGAIQEAFKPGTALPDSDAAGDATPRLQTVHQDTDRLVGNGTGGLD